MSVLLPIPCDFMMCSCYIKKHYIQILQKKLYMLDKDYTE